MFVVGCYHKKVHVICTSEHNMNQGLRMMVFHFIIFQNYALEGLFVITLEFKPYHLLIKEIIT